MNRRLVATILWFVAAWELGSAIDLVTAFHSDLIAPALAVIAATFAGLDPFRLIHPRPLNAIPERALSTADQGQTL
jgi:hypothetical protein